MTTAEITAQPRDRSPAFPVIGLEPALAKLVDFENHYKRTAARPEKVGEAWGIKTKAYADRIAAALRYYGLLEYQGSGKDRSIVVSEEARKYLRAQQEETKQQIIKAAALRPKQIAKFWGEWGVDRPADAACLDDLMLKYGFSEVGARDFLKVYDSTIGFAKLSDSDKPPDDVVDENDGAGAANGGEGQSLSGSRTGDGKSATKAKVKIMESERELTTGLLSKDASFRLIVSGQIGVKEIDRLIAKLQIDKEILAEQDAPSSDADRDKPPNGEAAN